MKKFRTIKSGITFFLDFDTTVEIIRARRPGILLGVDDDLTEVIGAMCCEYLDGLDAMDIWDYFESAILFTTEPPSSTTVVEED